MRWLLDLNIYLQGLIIGSIIIFINIVLVVALVSMKKNVTRKKIVYFSSFTGGMLLIASIVGQLVAARTDLIKNFENINSSHGKIDASPTWMQNLHILFIFALGLVLSILIIFSINKLHDFIEKRFKHDHKKVAEKSLLMIVIHRVPAAITMGGLIYMSNRMLPNGMQVNPLSIGTLILFIIHIVPESIYTFYNYLSTSKSKKQTSIFMMAASFVFIPLIMAGIALFKAIPSDYIYYRNILFIATGFVISWAVLSEMLPNILNNKDKNVVKKIMLFFILGFIVSIAIQVIHIH